MSRLSEPTLNDHVAALLPGARALVVAGLSNTASDDFHGALPADVKTPEGLDEDLMAQVNDWADAHFHLGIAVGLLLNPQTFLKGGA
jgi:hypothetical protein